jgi:hypothetical protein
MRRFDTPPRGTVMVNSRLKCAAPLRQSRSGTAISRIKAGLCSVNESFSKRLEFSENSRSIRIE